MDHWLPCRTSEAAHPSKNSEGKVWIEAAKCETLRRERVRCAMVFGLSTVIGTYGNGWCTFGDRRNIGDAAILGCRSAKGSFCLNRMSRIERKGVLQWGSIVAGGGVARCVTTLGGGGIGAGVMLLGVEPTLEVALPLSLGVMVRWVVGALAAILLILEPWRVMSSVALSGGPSC